MTSDGQVVPDFDDEVVAGTCLTHDGAVRHPPTAELLAAQTRWQGHPRHRRHRDRPRRRSRSATTRRDRLMDGIALLTIFVLAVFVGFEVVSKVSSTLHTPLMSGANAIHGIILVGAILVAGHADDPLTLVIALLAVVLATVNLVGGFVVTDRMLEMFKGGRSRGTGAARDDAAC